MEDSTSKKSNLDFLGNTKYFTTNRVCYTKFSLVYFWICIRVTFRREYVTKCGLRHLPRECFFFLKEDSRIENYYQLIVLNRWKMSSIGVIWFWKNVFWANVLSGGRIRGKCLEIIWNSLVLRRVLSQNNYRRRSVYNWFICSHLTVCFFLFSLNGILTWTVS